MKEKEDVQDSVCGENACHVSSPAVRQNPRLSATNGTIEIGVVSDVICPWCYVGKRHLEQAISNLAANDDGLRLSVQWYPYELNPGMPKGGMDRKEYRTRKFGSWERSLELDSQVVAAGRAAGLEFRHDLMKRTPNTFDAHRIIWLAGCEGVQDLVVEGLFNAYFSQGQDIGNSDVLIQVANQAGLDRSHLQIFLQNSAGSDEVRQEIEQFKSAGLQGVPTFVLNGQVLFSGAQSADVMSEVIRRALSTSSRR